MPLHENQIYTFKFTSGEEVIAKVTLVHQSCHPLQAGDGWVEVSDPVAVAPGPQGMGLIPALFTADHAGPITININNCVFVAQTDESVTTKYIQATTGLAVPDKKIVMG